MVEVIHEREVSGSNNIGMVLGVILAIAAIFIFFYYGSALLRNTTNTAPSTAIPEKVDVNINQPAQ